MKRAQFVKLYCEACDRWCAAAVKANAMRLSESAMTRFDAPTEAKKLWRKLGLKRFTAEEIRASLAIRFPGGAQ